MTPAALLTVSGAAVTRATAAPLRRGERLRLYAVEAAPAPIDAGDVVEVVPAGALGVGDTVLCEWEGRCRLALLARRADEGWWARVAGGDARLAPGAILGRVAIVEKADVLVDLGSRWCRTLTGLQGRLPARLAPAVRRLANLERLRHPLFPPLFLGPEDALLAQLRAAYDPEAPFFGEDRLDPDEQALLDRHLTPGLRLLDVGCGAGREAIAFARAGLRVTGVDLAPRMVEQARARAAAAGLAIDFAAGDLLTLALPAAGFDVVFLGAGVYSHIPGRARRVATLRRLRGLLASGGLVALAPLFHGRRPLLSRSRLVDALRRIGRAGGIRRLSEPGDVWQRGHALAPPPASFRFAHHFGGPAEVEAELSEAGLVVAERPGGGSLWVTRPT